MRSWRPARGPSPWRNWALFLTLVTFMVVVFLFAIGVLHIDGFGAKPKKTFSNVTSYYGNGRP